MHFHALFVYTCCCRLFYQHHLWPSGNITQHNEALGQHISRYPLGGSGILYQDIISWHYRNKERRTARVARSPAKMSARYSISGKVIRSPPPHIGCHLEKNKDPARGRKEERQGASISSHPCPLGRGRRRRRSSLSLRRKMLIANIYHPGVATFRSASPYAPHLSARNPKRSLFNSLSIRRGSYKRM